MQPLRFHMPVSLIRREGALSACGEQLAAFGRRCLIMTGEHGAAACGALDDALASLKAARVQATVFPHISENPSMEECRRAAQAAEAAGAHSILAIGGGSVMDAAKATAWMAANFVIDPETVYAASLRRAPLPLAVCGTTAGTGSEVSAVAVITDDNGRKRSIKHAYCYARVAFCDPRYTDTLPRASTVSTALDALAHTVEGFLNPSCNELGTLYAQQALPRLLDGLTWLCENGGLPPKTLRDELFDGALWAGMMLNAFGTAFPHPMGYVLTEDFGVPHGLACAVLMPELLHCAEQHAPKRANALYALCGTRERLYTVLDTLARTEVHMTDEQLASYSARFQDLPHYARVPGGYDSARADALLRSLFGSR
ncbi:MAG: iron-containing alcohol dehydrogenase [Acutalibacteraceae bacterium]